MATSELGLPEGAVLLPEEDMTPDEQVRDIFEGEHTLEADLPEGATLLPEETTDPLDDLPEGAVLLPDENQEPVDVPSIDKRPLVGRGGINFGGVGDRIADYYVEERDKPLDFKESVQLGFSDYILNWKQLSAEQKANPDYVRNPRMASLIGTPLKFTKDEQKDFKEREENIKTERKGIHKELEKNMMGEVVGGLANPEVVLETNPAARGLSMTARGLKTGFNAYMGARIGADSQIEPEDKKKGALIGAGAGTVAPWLLGAAGNAVTKPKKTTQKAKDSTIPTLKDEGIQKLDISEKRTGVPKVSDEGVKKLDITSSKDLSSSTPRKLEGELVTKEDLRKMGMSFQTSVQNDLAPLQDVSRAYSKKNNDVYLSAQDTIGDLRLNRLKNERQVNPSNIAASLIGDEKGKLSPFKTKDGIVQTDDGVKSFTSIQKSAREAGISTEQLNELRISANVLDDYKNLEIKRDELIKKGAGVEDQATLNKIDEELAEVLSKQPYQSYIDGAGKEIPLPRERAQQVLDDALKNPATKKYLDDEVAPFSKRLVDIRQEAGLISKAEADRMKEAHPYYLSSRRELDDLGMSDVYNAIHPTVKKSVEGRKISEKVFNADPNKNTMMDVTALTRAAQINRDRQQGVMHLIEHLDDGAWGSIFREPKQNVLQAIESIKLGKAPKHLNYDDILPLDPAKAVNKDQLGNLSLFIDGKKVTLTVTDDNFIKALVRPDQNKPLFDLEAKPFAKSKSKLLSKVDVHPGKIGKGFAQWTRATLTHYNPFFNIPATAKELRAMNINVDTKAVNTPIHNALSKATGGLYNIPRGVFHAAKLATNKEYYQYLKANLSPGLMNREFSATLGEDNIDNILRKELFNDSSSIGEKLIDSVATGGKMALKPFGELGEFTNIVARSIYVNDVRDAALARGLSAADAENAAMVAGRGLGANFSEQGSSRVARQYASMTAFVKSQGNSVTKSLAAGVYRPKQLTAALTGMVGVQLAAIQYNEQFKDADGKPLLDDIAHDERTKNIVLFNPGATEANDYTKIPGIFEFWGKASGTAARGIDTFMLASANNIIAQLKNKFDEDIATNKKLQNALVEEDITAKEYWRLQVDSLIGHIEATSFIPSILQPVAGISTNKDAFGRDIVSKNVATTPMDREGDRFTPGKTDELSKDIGRKLNYNPELVDYIKSKTLNGLDDFVTTSWQIGKQALTGEEFPEPEAKSIPGVSKVSGKGSAIPRSDVQTHYSRVTGDIKEKLNTLNDLEKHRTDSPRAEEAYRNYRSKYEGIVAIEHVVEDYEKRLKDRYDILNRLTSTQNRGISEMTPEKEFLGDPKLREEIDIIRKEVFDIKKEALEELEANKHLIGDIWERKHSVSTQTEKVFDTLFNSDDTDGYEENKNVKTN